MQFGRYLVDGQVGQGGMGTVFRARDPDSGEPVALKTLAGARARDLDYLRREIRALARLSHPGIVAVLDHGVADGVPWYAMPLLPGATLADRLSDSLGSEQTWLDQTPVGAPLRGQVVDHDLAPEELLALCARLAWTLAWLHGEGIVHRDLKPDNVFLDAEGHPVLGDFGLVVRFDRSMAPEDALSGGGTPRYMAPEQARGEQVDPRADLFALGRMLFETLDGFSPEVDGLIGQLLAPDPVERLGFAADVALTLGRVAGADGGLPEGWPVPREFLYRPRFTGRQEVLDQVAVLTAGAVRGRGGSLLLTGEAGAGKSRLLTEAIRPLRRAGARVLVGRTLPVGARPLQLFRGLAGAVGDVCRMRGPAATNEILGQRGPLLAAAFLELAEVPGVRPIAGVQLETVATELGRALAEVVLGWTRGGPAVVLLEDLHWAQALDLEVLRGFSAEWAAGGGVLLCTCRSESLPDGIDVDRRVDLAGLDPGEVRAFVAGMLALREPPNWFVDDLMARTEGNPYFLAEYLYAAVDHGQLRREEGGRWSVEGESPVDLGLPERLAALVSGRLALLDSSALKLVGLAAVFGRSSDRLLLERAWEVLGQEDPASALQECARRRIFDPDQRQRIRFSHDPLREVASAGLEDAERRALHRAAAEACEALADRCDLGEAAVHWEAAAEADRALVAYLHAGRAAVSSRQLLLTRPQWQGVLRVADGSTEQGVRAMVEACGHLLQQHLDVERVGPVVREALAGCDRLGLGSGVRSQALVYLSAVERRARRIDEAVALAVQAVEALDATTGPEQRAGALANLAQVRRLRGEMDEAMELFAQAGELHPDPAFRGSYVLAIANTLSTRGRASQALPRYDRAVELYRQTGHFHEGLVHMGRGNCLTRLGRMEEALASHKTACGIYEAAGSAAWTRATRMNVAYTHTVLGEFDEAGALFDAIEAGKMDREVAVYQVLQRSLWCALQGDLAGMQEVLARVDPETARATDRVAAIYAEQLGWCAVLQGDGVKAEAAFRRGMEVGLRAHFAEGVLRSGLQLALVLVDRGAFDEASALLAELEQVQGFEEDRLARVAHVAIRGRLVHAEGRDARPFAARARELLGEVRPGHIWAAEVRELEALVAS